MVHAPERTVNRYYDPTTDQFLSIDPALMVTDQPYMFTNDDPLNATDPIGLCGRKGIIGYYPGDCATTAKASIAAGKYIESHVPSGGFSVQAGLHSVTNAAKTITTFTRNNVGTLATGTGIGICIFLSVGVCAVATALAFGARVVQRHQEGTSYLSSSNYIDAGVTTLSFGLLSGPADLGSQAFNGNAVYAFRTFTAAPDIFGWTVGYVSGKQIP